MLFQDEEGRKGFEAFVRGRHSGICKPLGIISFRWLAGSSIRVGAVRAVQVRSVHARLPWGGALLCAYLWKRDGSPRLSRSLPGFSPIAESNGLQVWRFRNVAPAAAETAQNCMRNTDKYSIGYPHSIKQ